MRVARCDGPATHRRVGTPGQGTGEGADPYLEDLRGLLPRGGTILGTRRGSPLDRSDGVDLVRAAIGTHGLDAVVVVGGNGSLTVATMLADDHGLPIVGVPKTIDNDVVGTDECFGFDTALQVAVRGPEIGSDPMSVTRGRTRTIDLGLLDGVTAALLG